MEPEPANRQIQLVLVIATTFFLGLLIGFGVCWQFFAQPSQRGLVEVNPSGGGAQRGSVVAQTLLPAAGARARIGTFTSYRDRVGQSFLVNVTGATKGEI